VVLLLFDVWSGVESNSIDSTSSAKKFICRWREPSPMTMVNFPSPKLMILPLMMLPSLRRIVSAKTKPNIDKTRKQASAAR
jgi:hypothetical protein